MTRLLAFSTLALVAALSQPVEATTLKTVFTFNGTNGSGPMGGLISDGTNAFYGTTQYSGALTKGLVFKLTPPEPGKLAWRTTTLVAFTGRNGDQPVAGLVADKAGNLYGTTSAGGTSDAGTVFQLKPPAPGKTDWTLKTLVNFTGKNGSAPLGRLLLDASGNLYGTTSTGGPSKVGTVFRLTPPPKGKTDWTLKTLFAFNAKNGYGPSSGLIMDAAGALYGTTVSGTVDDGTVFKLSPPAPGKTAWTLKTLVVFDGSDGNAPGGGVVMDKAGKLYGVTKSGGSWYDGTVYRLTPPASGKTTWTLDTLVHFNGANGDSPRGDLVLDKSGALYGTTSAGGAADKGTVFKLTPPASGKTWTLKTLVSFTEDNGKGPEAGLLPDGAGDFLGTTFYGGTWSDGTVFKLTP